MFFNFCISAVLIAVLIVVCLITTTVTQEATVRMQSCVESGGQWIKEDCIK